ncbi:hypothetical protein D3C72_1083280 [compost metagenome]
MDADVAAIEEEVNALRKPLSATPAPAQAPRRMRLPAELPRTDIHHEPASDVPLRLRLEAHRGPVYAPAHAEKQPDC